MGHVTDIEFYFENFLHVIHGIFAETWRKLMSSTKIVLGFNHLVVHKILRKAKFSYSLICTPTGAYLEERNVSFSENFAGVINE